MVNGMSITNKTFEATLKILVDDLRRDKTGQILIRVRELADGRGDHKLVSADAGEVDEKDDVFLCAFS
jgi:hypothetical protein